MTHARTLSVVIVGGCVLCAPPLAQAVTYHVSPAGCDTAPGSLAQPLRTIQHCADLAAPGDICTVHSGVYRETVRPTRSGSATAHIRLEAAAGECVTVSGADVLAGSWLQYQGSIYTSPVHGNFVQLFVDGQMMNEARWPNATVDDLVHMPMSRSGFTGASATGMVGPNLPAGDWTGAYVFVVPGQQWVSWTRQIATYDVASKTMTWTAPINNPVALTPRGNDLFFIFGSLALLDAASEWFLDSTQGKVYLWPPSGSSPTASVVEVKRRDWAFDLSAVSYVEVAGFQVFGAAINMSGDHCLVQGVQMRYPTHTRETEGYNTPWTDPAVFNTVGGSFNEWRDGVVAFSAGSGFNVSGNSNTVTNNIVHDASYALVGQGILVANASQSMQDIEISHNTVTRTGRDGLSILGSSDLTYTLTNSHIIYNRISQPMLLGEDGGTIHTWGIDGTGSEIAYNELSDIDVVFASGVYLDDGSRNFAVHHNYIHDSTWWGVTIKRPNMVINNTILRTTRGAADGSLDVISEQYEDLSTATFANNIYEERAGLQIALVQPVDTDYGFYEAAIAVPLTSANVVVPFSSFSQDWVPGTRRPLQLGSITNLQLRSATQGDYDIWLDNINVQPIVADGLIDDFVSSSARFAGTWWSAAGTGATATFVTAADAGNPAGHFSGTTPWDSWGEAGKAFTTPVNLTSSTGISFDVHGTAKLGFGSGPTALIPKNNADCPIGTDQIPTTTCAIDQGLLFSPYTDGFAGAAPDLGAFESGKPRWTAGATTVENWLTCPASTAPANCAVTPDAGSDVAVGGQDAQPIEGGMDWTETLAEDAPAVLGPMDAGLADAPVSPVGDAGRAAADAQLLEGGPGGADTVAARDARAVQSPLDAGVADAPLSPAPDASRADSASQDSPAPPSQPAKASGCGCRVGGRGSAQPSLPIVILAGLSWIMAARRRARAGWRGSRQTAGPECDTGASPGSRSATIRLG
jgi:hypothetical protein